MVTGLGARWIGTAQFPGRELIGSGAAVAFGSALVSDNDKIVMVPLVPRLARDLYLIWGPATSVPDGTRLGTVLLDYYVSQAELMSRLRAATGDDIGGEPIERP